MSSQACKIFLFWAALDVLSIARVAAANDESNRQISIGTAHERSWIIQYQFGFASDADFIPSLFFLVDESREQSKLHSLSVGKVISDSLYGRELDVSVHLGVQYFAERGFQNDIAGTTAYWRLAKLRNLPYTNIPIKISLAQGLSYVADIPTAEVRDFAPEVSAKLTHYMEFGLHFSLRNQLSKKQSPLSYWFDDINIGYTIFHRSSVFGLFADKGGGINFPGVAIEFILK